MELLRCSSNFSNWLEEDAELHSVSQALEKHPNRSMLSWSGSNSVVLVVVEVMQQRIKTLFPTMFYLIEHELQLFPPRSRTPAVDDSIREVLHFSTAEQKKRNEGCWFWIRCSFSSSVILCKIFLASTFLMGTWASAPHRSQQRKHHQ